MDGVEVRTLTDGGQPAEDTANALAAFVGAAQKTLEVAIYDLNLPDPVGEIVGDEFRAAEKRGVAIRLAYNADHAKDTPIPPPPMTVPAFVEAFPFPTEGIPGIPDLMHHKYVVRDGAAVWTGSTNWTLDSWTREENVIVTVESPALAARYLEDFEQLWTTRQRLAQREGRHGAGRRDRERGSARGVGRSSRTGSRSAIRLARSAASGSRRR